MAVVTVVLAAVVGTAVLVAVDTGVDSEAFLFTAFMAPTRRTPARAGAFTDRGAVRAVGSSPGGRLLATASAEREYSSTGTTGISLFHVAVILWDVAAPAHPAQASCLTHSRGNLWAFACAVVFSPDGRLLATVSSDQAVTLWDVTDPGHPAETATLAISPHYFLGPSVHAVAFSPDGRLLATGSDNQTVILWDVSDSARPAGGATIAGQGGAVHTVAFSPDGRLLATGSPIRPCSCGVCADPRKILAASPTPRTLGDGSLVRG